MRLLLLLGVVAAFDHIISFNAHCNATFEFLAGTPAQMGFTAGRVPFQFLNSLQRVLKARVSSVPNCQPFSLDEGLTWPRKEAFATLFGFDVINLLRFIDANDTVIEAAKWPSGCSNSSFGFNWADLKRIIKGIVLPSTCQSKNFYDPANPGCRLKFRIIDQFEIELSVKDTCDKPGQTGWHLPQFEARCVGAYCNLVGKPCTSNNDCGGGSLGCDPINLFLGNASQVLLDLGLYDSFDNCPANNGFDHTEQFFSQIVNNIANLLGYGALDNSKMWKQLSLCGVQAVQSQFVPSQAPTPMAMYVCQNGTRIPLSRVCDNIPDCDPSIQFASDEGRGTQCCATGKMRSTRGTGACCSVCGDKDDDCDGSFLRGGLDCSLPERSSEIPSFIQFNDDRTITLTNLYPSTGTATVATAIPFKSVDGASADDHVAFWADCFGSIQIGNPADIGVLNGFGPYHQIAARVETILTSTQQCRNQSDVTPEFMKRQFFAWGITWLGGMFMDTLSATTKYGGVTPGALFDNFARWYKSAGDKNGSNYVHSPPFANLDPGPWTTCTLGTLQNDHACQVNALVQSWFKGTGFPTSWANLPATVMFRVASDCNVDLGSNFRGDSFPNVFVQCHGACTAGPPSDQDSGCCLMRKPFVVVSALQNCPQGYFRSSIESFVTDFVFPKNTTQTTFDTTLINFLNLLSGRKFDFDNSLPFFDVKNAVQAICIVNTSGLGDAVDNWANGTFTERCPKGWTPQNDNGQVGCPQILAGGGLQSCGLPGQTACVGTPTGDVCPATGCPQTPAVPPCGPLNLCAGAWAIAPSLVSMGLLFTMLA